MAIVEMKVPVIGESVTEVTLSQWLKEDGAYIELDEPICEFESDKATLEFPAEAAGKLIYVAAEGDDLEIGALVARVDTSVTKGGSESAPPPKAEPKEAPKKSAPAAIPTGEVIEMRVPVIGESVTEVTLSQWLIEDGGAVSLDQPICEFESDKATLEFPAEGTGKLIHVAAEGEDLEIGALVAKIEIGASGEASTSTSAAAPADNEVTSEANDNYASGHPSPAAMKILAENNIKAEEVKGTGKDGRITKEDALKAVEAKKAAPVKTEAPAPKTETKEVATEAASVSVAFSRNESRKKMSRMRRTIAKRLVAAKNETAMLTTFNEVDMSGIIALRKKYQEKFVAKYGIKLGFMSLFTKACAKVLLEMPDVNAFIDTDTNEVIYHDYADISIAISTPRGLVVPPVKNAESLNFADIEKKIKELAVKARDGKLTLDEMSGGTFTITNGGIFGSLNSTPIINPPQSAILGMHAIKERPIAVNGELAIRPMMNVALSYDHRIIDGRTSVTFLVKVKELLEDPVELLLDL